MLNLIFKIAITDKFKLLFLVPVFIILSCNRGNNGGVHICHYDKASNSWETISVKLEKVDKHLEHGDAVGGGCEEYTFIADVNFEQVLFDLQYDDHLDNHILISNIDSITDLTIEGRPDLKIKDLKGIEAFKNLKTLNCRGNDLKELDLSQNISLKALYCYENEITKIDLSNNPNLEVLFCGSNKLSSLDVSRNINLKELNCYNNELKSLDLSNNISLERLWVQVNQLTNLDLSKNLKLTTLHCDHNPFLKSMDVSNNVNLEILYCHYNKLTSLDLSRNLKLKTLHCNDNDLTFLNLKNGNNNLLIGSEFRSQNNPSLNCIQVDNKSWSNSKWKYKDAHTTFTIYCND